jgi:hypothetical protein
VGRLRSLALGHAFVLYGLLWVAAGTNAIWRLLAGHKSWIKTDRLDEVADSKFSATTWGMWEPGRPIYGNWNLQAQSEATADADAQGEGWHRDQARGWHWDMARHSNFDAKANLPGTGSGRRS